MLAIQNSVSLSPECKLSGYLKPKYKQFKCQSLCSHSKVRPTIRLSFDVIQTLRASCNG